MHRQIEAVRLMNELKPGNVIETIHGKRHIVKDVGMLEYPVCLADVIPVPACTTGDGRYFNLTLSGIKKVN